MSDKDISQEILDKIKEVKPKPRWEFVLKNYVIWGVALVALVFSSLAFAAVLYMLLNNDWDVYMYISGNLLEFVFLTLPYFWIIFLGLLIIVAYYNFRHTKKGYKFSLSKVFLACLTINILLGTAFYQMGVGQAIDTALAKRVPFYGKFVNRRPHIWSQAEKGLLAGVVLDVRGDRVLIEDINGHIWDINYHQTSTPIFISFKPGDPVRIVGEQIDNENFQVEMILPMKGMRWIRDGKLMSPDMNERKLFQMRIKN